MTFKNVFESYNFFLIKSIRLKKDWYEFKKDDVLPFNGVTPGEKFIITGKQKIPISIVEFIKDEDKVKKIESVIKKLKNEITVIQSQIKRSNEKLEELRTEFERIEHTSREANVSHEIGELFRKIEKMTHQLAEKEKELTDTENLLK